MNQNEVSIRQVAIEDGARAQGIHALVEIMDDVEGVLDVPEAEVGRGCEHGNQQENTSDSRSLSGAH